MVRDGRTGRPPKRVPADLALTQRIKHTDRHGHLLSIETRATIGTPVTPPGTTRVERLNGVLRDRLNAFTRKTHAFAKTVDTWDAALDLALFEHNWLRPHPALRVARNDPPHGRGPRFTRRTPAMALAITDHPWPWTEFLAMPIPITR